MLDGMKNCAAFEFSGAPLTVPSEESNTPFLPSCSRSLLPSCVYFCTMPEGAARDPDVAVLVDVTAVQARIKQVRIAPGIDHVAGRINLDDRRSQISGIQFALEHVLAIEG